MGMFDSIYFKDVSTLPLTDSERKVIDNQTEWQTKDLDKVLDVYIVDKKELKRIESEVTRVHDRCETLEDIASQFKVVERYEVNTSITDNIVIYCYEKGVSIDLKLTIENGVVTKVER